MFLFDGAAASLRTADVSPRTPSAAMSDEKRLPFAGQPVPGVQLVRAVRSKKESEKIKVREEERTSLPSNNSVSAQSRSLFSASFQTFCLTVRAYLNTQKYQSIRTVLHSTSATTASYSRRSLHDVSFVSWFVLTELYMSIQSCAIDCILRFFPCNLGDTGIQFSSVHMLPCHSNLSLG